MKKLKLLLLCVMLLLTLAACGGETEQTEGPEEEEVQEILPPEGEMLEEELPEENAEEPAEEEPPAPPAEEKPSTGSESSGKVKIPEPHKTYYFRINLKTCTVNIYTKDESGEFTVPYRAMVCSTGYATPKSGVFRIGNIWEWLRLKGNVYGHYVVQISGNILFHSVPYLRWGDPGSLEYWEFDKLGTKASQGCIRLQIADAIWVYNNGRDIAGVEFYSDDDPGPFGKPEAPKISDNELCRDWDPTDPDPENPWHSYLAGEGENTEEIDPETGLPIDPETGLPIVSEDESKEDNDGDAEENLLPGEEAAADTETVPEGGSEGTEPAPGDASDLEESFENSEDSEAESSIDDGGDPPGGDSSGGAETA